MYMLFVSFDNCVTLQWNISCFIVSIYVHVCVCPYRLHKFNLVPIILEMEVTVNYPVSLFFLHCPFICWFSLAHSVSFTEVPNVVVRSQTEGSLPRKSQQPAKKNDIWEPVLRSLVLAPLISSFLAENCRMRSLNTFELAKDRKDSQFWLIWGYLVTPIWGNVHMPRKPLMFFNWVSSYPRGQIRPPKRWAWSTGETWRSKMSVASRREATLIFDLHVSPVLQENVDRRHLGENEFNTPDS